MSDDDWHYNAQCAEAQFEAEIEELRAERDRAREECGHEKAMRKFIHEEMSGWIRMKGEQQASAEAAEATLSRLREVLAGHPECDVHPDDDPVACGWKRAVTDVRNVLADS